MIVINLDLAISLIISITLILVISSWFRYTKEESRSLKQTKDVVQCPYCSYVFVDFLKKEIKTCPQCESYIEKKEKTMKNDLIKKEDKATVLVTVIMLVLAMTILSIGILGAMGSQGLLGQNQVDRIKAEQLVKGAFWKYYIQQAQGNLSAVTITETLDGKTYTATVSPAVAAAGPHSTYTITTTTNY